MELNEPRSRGDSSVSKPDWLDAFVIAGGPLPFAPLRVLPSMPGRYGLSVNRTLAATALFAASLALMRLIPNMTVGAAVIPLWCASAGVLVDGLRGMLRGIIIAVVYPVYCAILIAIAFGVFWAYALIHALLAGDRILW